MRSPAVRAGIAVTVSTPPPQALSSVSVSAVYVHALCSVWPVCAVRLMSSFHPEENKAKSLKGVFNQDGTSSERQPDFVAYNLSKMQVKKGLHVC